MSPYLPFSLYLKNLALLKENAKEIKYILVPKGDNGY